MLPSGSVDPERNYGEDVIIKKWKNPDEAVKMVRQIVLCETSLGGISHQNIMTLFTADLLKSGSPIKGLLDSDDRFELLTPYNYSSPTEKIRYTTLLKSKGLRA